MKKLINIIFIMMAICLTSTYAQEHSYDTSHTFLFEHKENISKKRLLKSLKKELTLQEKWNKKQEKINKNMCGQISKLDTALKFENLKSQTQKISAQAKKLEAIKNVAIKELKTDDLIDKIDHLLDKVNKNQQIDDELQKSIKKLNITQGNNKHLKQLQQLVALKKNWQKYYEDQSHMEQQLLYLIQAYQIKNNPYKNMQTEEDLWKAGYQTQSSVQKSVAKSTGKTEAEATNFLNEKQKEAIQQQQDKLNQIKNKTNNYQEQYNQAKGQLDEIKNTKLPNFKTTPMVMRWKPIYQFNVKGQNILTKNNQMVVNLGIEHSINRNFSQGFGIYNNIDFSLRKPYIARWGQTYLAYYLNYKMIAGFHLQAGYEYNIINTHKQAVEQSNNNWLSYLTLNNNNIAYIGIQKRYRINNKWQGNIMIGYDFLYHGPTTIKSTPWIIRIGINK